MSRVVTISAISTRGGASRMSIPDGSRQRTSWRSDSATRSVGRSRIDGASTGTLSSARRSPNWRLPSIRTVRWSSWPRATARLNAIVVLPTPPFGAKTEKIRDEPVVDVGVELLADLGDPVHQVEARERHRQDAVDALRPDRPSTGFWGTVRTMTGTPSPASAICSTSWQALDPALEQRVDEDDVRSELLDLGQDLAAVGQDVEQLDRALRVQQAADVLRHLRDVLDEQQARLVTGCHRAECTKPTGAASARKSRSAGRAVRTSGRAVGLRATRIARSLPGPSGSQVVVAGELLDVEPGVLGHRAQLVGADEPQRVAPDPADRRLARRALPRRSWSGRRPPVVGVVAGPPRPSSRAWPVSGSRRSYSRISRPSKRARSSASGSQTSTTARPPGARWRGHRPERLALGVAGREQEQRVEGDERRADTCRPSGRSRSSRSASTSSSRPARRGAGVARPSAGARSSIAGSRSTAGHVVAGRGQRDGEAARAGGQLEDRPAGPRGRGRGTGRGRPGPRRGRGRRGGRAALGAGVARSAVTGRRRVIGRVAGSQRTGRAGRGA